MYVWSFHNKKSPYWLENFKKRLSLPWGECVSDSVPARSHAAAVVPQQPNILLLTRVALTALESRCLENIYLSVESCILFSLWKGVFHGFYSSPLILVFNEVLVLPIMILPTTIHCGDITSWAEDGVLECVKAAGSTQQNINQKTWLWIPPAPPRPSAIISLKFWIFRSGPFVLSSSPCFVGWMRSPIGGT